MYLCECVLCVCVCVCVCVYVHECVHAERVCVCTYDISTLNSTTNV